MRTLGKTFQTYRAFYQHSLSMTGRLYERTRIVYKLGVLCNLQ